MSGLRVKPFYNPPSLVLKQLRSALLIRKLTGWTKLPWWTTQAGTIFQIAAGCQGIGCFGYPAHPVWEVTARCNLKCDHCHARGGDDQMADELTTDEGKSLVIDGLAEVDEFRTLVFSGGEPMVREDIYDLIRHAKVRGFYPLMATNATLITPSAATELRRAGLLGIAASIDSLEDGVHDTFRRMDGALKLAKEGIANASAEGMYIQINITASRINKEEIPEIIAFADALRAHVILLYQFIPCGRGKDRFQLEFTAEEFRQEIISAGALQKDLHPVIAPVGLPEYWALHNVAHNGGTGSDVLRGCICGNGMFYVKANGDVWPCAFVPMAGGNVRTSKPSQIWTSSELFAKLRDRSNLKGICSDCSQRDVCGGCRARALAHTNDLFAGDPKCALTEGERRGATQRKG